MGRFLKYLGKRVLSYALMIFISTSLTFFLASSFMDPRSNYESRTPRPPQESIERALDEANINDKTPVLERYGNWLHDVVFEGDFGLSPMGESVNDAIASRVGSSVKLLALSTILSIIVGVGLGVYSAQHQYQWQDRLFSGAASLFMVIPTVVLAILVVFAAIWINDAAGARIFYVTGLSSYTGSDPIKIIVDFLQHVFLPTVVLTIISAVSYHLSQRTYLLDEMNADYVRTARAKGLTRKQAIRKHALRNSLIPTAVNIAFSIASMFTGAVMTEKVFAVHGVGEYFINCISTNDINGAVAVAAFTGLFTLIGALLADLFAAALDPRIKMD